MELTLLCSLFIAAVCNSIIDVQYPIFSSQLHLIEHALADAPPLDTPKSSDISDREESHYDSENNCFDNHNTENRDIHDDKEYIRKFWICVAILALFFIVIYWM